VISFFGFQPQHWHRQFSVITKNMQLHMCGWSISTACTTLPPCGWDLGFQFDSWPQLTTYWECYLWSISLLESLFSYRLVDIVGYFYMGSLYSLLNILWQSNRRIISKGFPHSGFFPNHWPNLVSLVEVMVVSYFHCNIVLSLVTVDWWKLLIVIKDY